MAKLARIQGTVSIEITVGVDGVPIAAHATEGPMQLRQAAEAYALKWRFEPVKGNGVPVIGTWPLKVMYQLR
jgi:outer membrane biosynthesis protein TonB